MLSNNNYRGTRAEIEGNFDVTKETEDGDEKKEIEEEEVEYFIEIT